MPRDLSGDKSTFVQVMAWCRQATSHYLHQCRPTSMSQHGITRPQWVNLSHVKFLWGNIEIYLYQQWNAPHYWYSPRKKARTFLFHIFNAMACWWHGHTRSQNIRLIQQPHVNDLVFMECSGLCTKIFLEKNLYHHYRFSPLGHQTQSVAPNNSWETPGTVKHCLAFLTRLCLMIRTSSVARLTQYQVIFVKLLLFNERKSDLKIKD